MILAKRPDIERFLGSPDKAIRAALIYGRDMGVVRDRARAFGQIAAVAAIALFAAGYAFVAFGGLGFRIEGAVDPAGPSNPLRAASLAAPGGWLSNFSTHRWMWIAPFLGFAGALLALVGIRAAALWCAGAPTAQRTSGRPRDRSPIGRAVPGSSAATDLVGMPAESASSSATAACASSACATEG